MHTLTHVDNKLVATRLGINTFSQAMQDNVLSRLEAIILSRLTAKISGYLTDDEQEKLEEESNVEFLKQRIGNFDDIAQGVARETIAEFRKRLQN